jgi:hypothetical protein
MGKIASAMAAIAAQDSAKVRPGATNATLPCCGTPRHLQIGFFFDGTNNYNMGGGTIHLGGGGSPGSGSGATPQAPDKAIGVDEAGKPIQSKRKKREMKVAMEAERGQAPSTELSPSFDQQPSIETASDLPTISETITQAEQEKGLLKRFLEWYSPLIFMDENEEKALLRERFNLVMEGKMQGFEGILELDYALSKIPINPMHYLPGPDAEDMARMQRNSQTHREDYKRRVQDHNRRWVEFQKQKNEQK